MLGISQNLGHRFVGIRCHAQWKGQAANPVISRLVVRMPSSKPATDEAQQSQNILNAALPASNRIVSSVKLRPPRGREGHVIRSRLIDALNHDIERQFTVVVAPAGYGKSTLVAQWLRHVSMPWAWIAPGPEDDNLRSMLQLIVAAIKTMDPELVARIVPVIENSSHLNDDQLANQLIEDLSLASRVFILVIDDTHFLKSPAVWTMLLRFQQALADIVRLVLIGRSEPHLPLARWRVAGEVSQFGPEELAFTRQESIEFLAASKLSLAEIDIDRLYDATEGWVAALKLASLALVELPPVQFHERLDRMAGRGLPVLGSYLWQEVFDLQSPDIQFFLLATSILDRFCADLCNAVAGVSNGGELIRECLSRNLFIVALDDTNTWFRYHHLVSDLLREHAAESLTIDETRLLHQRAAIWLEANGYLAEAVRHAINAADWERTIALAGGICRELFNQDRMHEIRAILNSIPRPIVLTSPELSFFLAWAKARTGHWPQSLEIIQQSEAAWSASTDPHEQGLLSLWKAQRSLVEIDGLTAIRHGERAVALITTQWPVEYALALISIAIAQTHLGNLIEFRRVMAELRQITELHGPVWLDLMEKIYSAMGIAGEGNLRESTALIDSAIGAAGTFRTAIWLQPAYLQLGKNYQEWGLFDDALDFLQTASELAIASQSFNWRPRIHLAIATLHWSMGDHPAAFEEINSAGEFANLLGMRDHQRHVRAIEARFFVHLGQVELARRWADSANLDPADFSNYRRQQEYLTYIRFLILDRRADDALRIVLDMRRDAEANGRRGDLVELGIFETLALKANGDSAGALRALTPALELGSREGYFQSFIDDGVALVPVLRHLATHGSHRDYVNQLIARIEGAPVPAMPNQIGSDEALSQREMEVLRLVAEGYANRDVGERLFISEKTVKKHMSNILGKLGASNRTQAVDLGRRKQLI